MKKLIVCAAVVVAAGVVFLAYLTAIGYQPCEFGPCQIQAK